MVKRVEIDGNIYYIDEHEYAKWVNGFKNEKIIS